MSEELTPFIAESDELLRTTKKQLAKLRIRTFKGLARRKRGTLLKQIPDMSPHALLRCEQELIKRKFDFVPDEIISPVKHRVVSLNNFSRLWKNGIMSWRHVSRIFPEKFIIERGLSVACFCYIENMAQELGYKPPHNDFRRLDLSSDAQAHLFNQRLFSIRDLRETRFGVAFRLTKYPIIHRQEVLYQLWKHGVHFHPQKKKKKTP